MDDFVELALKYYNNENVRYDSNPNNSTEDPTNNVVTFKNGASFISTLYNRYYSLNGKNLDLTSELSSITNSNFMNPSGLYDDNHYTTAYDLYLIFNECIKNEDFVKIISAESYTAEITKPNGSIEKIKWEPTNYYALGSAKSPENVTIVGGKTGTLKVAGNCLILMAKDNSDNPYISIVMGADSKDYLYQDMTKLLSEITKSE